MANYVSRIRAEFDARQATEAMYALSERARYLNKLLEGQRKRWEEASDEGVKKSIEDNMKRLEAEIAAVEKLNKTIEKSITTESAFQQVLNGKEGSMSVARLESAQRNARAIMRNINPQDEGALDQMDEANRVMTEAGKRLASLKNGFTDAMGTVQDGVEGKAIPELKRLEAALTEAQKFSVDQNEWNRYAEAIGKVRLEMQSASVATVGMDEANAKIAASLKNGFEDAFATFSNGIDDMALPELKRLEAALTETQKFSVDAEEWQRYGSAIDEVKIKIQGITGEYLSVEKAMGYAGQIEKQTFTGTIADLEQAKKLLTDYRKTIAQTADGAKELKEIDHNLEIIEDQIKGVYLTTEKFNEILSNPKGKSFDELKQAVEKAEKQLYSMRRETDEEREAFTRLHGQIEGAKEEMKDFGDVQEDTSKGMDDLIGQAKRLAGAYLGLQGFQKVWQDNLDLSDQMAAVRKTTGMTAEAVAELSEKVKSIDSRAAVEQLMALSATAGQLGLSSEQDVLGFTKAANQITVSLDELGTDGVLNLMKVAQVSGALDQEMGDVETTLLKAGSAINELSAASSATAGPITDFIARVGGVASTAKISMSEIAALGATTDALAISAELAGTQTNIFIGGMQKNTKAVADLLGVSKDYVQEMLDNGQAMDVFVDVMEKLGDLNANQLDDFLKQMGSSGSRATQVFATLSKNVDQLRANLEVSNEAYREGISITDEYNKVNDTAAGKFERLKNEIREMFISNNAQKFFGSLIDGLRTVVRWIAEDGPIVKGLKVIIAYVAALKLGLGSMVLSAGAAMKTLGTGIMALANITGTMLGRIGVSLGLVTARTKQARIEWQKLDATMKANVWGAVIAAIGAIAYKLWDMHKAAKEAAAEVGKFNEKLNEEKRALDSLFAPLKNSNTEQRERSRLISEINSKYGKYLGYMLSETNSAIQLADAHALIAKRIREEAYEKRILDQEDAVRQKHDEDVNAAYGNIEAAVRGGKKGNANITDITDTLKDLVDKNMNKIIEAGKYLPKTLVDEINGMTDRLVADGKLTRDGANKARTALYKYLDEAKEQAVEINKATANTRADLRNVRRGIAGDINANLNDLVGNIQNFGKKTVAKTTPTPIVQNTKGGIKIPGFEPQQFDWKGNAGTQPEAAAPLPGWKPNINKKNIEEVRQFVKAQDDLRGYLEANADHISDSTRKTAEMYLVAESEMKELRKLLPKELDITDGTDGVIGSGGGGGGRGLRSSASSSYANMTPDELVERKKKMKENVGQLGTDADVKRLINEDKALAAAFKGRVADMKSVIEWYNRERLKIQSELDARHLTGTGDFKNPKQEKGRRKRLQDDMSAYLEELDAYYMERKTKIQEAGNNEGITEAEVRNRTLATEAEWYQRRAELQQMYSSKAEKVTKDEQDAILAIIADRTEDDVKYIKATINQTVKFSEAIRDANEQGAKEYRKFQGDLDSGAQRDFNKVQMTIQDQLKAIQDIIDKERPFNGITKNLRENLVTMGILTADMSKERDKLMKENADMTDFNARQAAEEVKRTAFMLGEAENAYSTTIEDVMRRMADAGMDAWADELRQNPKMQEGLMAQLRQSYDAIQEAIKKEASQLKKQAEIMWNNILMPDGKTTLKDATDRAIAQLGIEQGRVSRANSLIGAGAQSERVADKLAIKQMQIQLTMQEHYYNLMKKRGQAAVDMLNAQAKAAKERGDTEEATRKTLDAQHAAMALNLATAKEETELAKQREDIIARTEESQNRLYTQLREWGDLLASSMKDIFEASHAGDAEYYNERAKMQLTGKGGPGAGTYIVIDNEGTEDARAHYEYLDERAALERQHEIEQQNALAEAWRKVMDDINTKMNDTITDMMNAMWQDAAVNANTDALGLNTKELYDLIAAMNGGSSTDFSDASKISRNKNGMAVDSSGQVVSPIQPAEAEQPAATSYWPLNDEQLEKVKGYQAEAWDNHVSYGVEKLSEMSDAVAEMPSIVANPVPSTDEDLATLTEKANAAADVQIAASDRMADKVLTNQNKIQKAEKDTEGQMVKGTQSAFAKMTQAANLYGIAYQAMSNDNLSSAQKFEMIALQAVGQGAIAALTTNLAQTEGEVATQMPGILGKAVSQLGPIAGPAAFAVLTGILGGLMGMAVSKIAKSKSQIAQVTGASASAGRLATGMLTYAEGNVNEFTDPNTLTPGRQYNVDAADGRTYRARYMGSNPKTHLTNGPEFHLSGERGREMIIDAGTTRQITMNDNEIWHAIQTLSGGGRLSATRRRGRGVRAFADGNVDDFETMEDGRGMMEDGGMDLTAIQGSLDRNTAVQEALLERLNQPIVAQNILYGPDGLPNVIAKLQKEAKKHGEKYL